ncbi:hypothetical protein TU74_08355 [Pseudomonas lundensis]|nr:hypothetical protein TU74_08355 [Pseudomonas lundensis]
MLNPPMDPMGATQVEPIGSVYVKTHLVHYFKMNRTDPQFKLRIPVELKETLDAKADENSRSLSNEMLKRLEVTIELDELLAVSGGFIYAAGVLANLIKENQALKSERDEFRSLVKSEFSKLLDERIDLLESRLLSLPGSSFGKAVAKTKT